MTMKKNTWLKDRKLKVLIIGATGMLGHRVALEFLKDGEEEIELILWGGNRNILAMDFFNEQGYVKSVLPTCLIDTSEVDLLLGVVNPDVIINCAGIIKQKQGNDIKTMRDMVRLNTDLPLQLAEFVMDRECTLYNFSSDCVFSGRKAGFYKDDEPDSPSLYGRTKAIAEMASLKRNKIKTIRTSFIGYELSGNVSLLEWLLSNKGESIFGYNQAIWTGVTTAYIARFLMEEIRNSGKYISQYHKGVCNLAAQPISKFDLLNMVVDALNLNIEIKPCYTFIEDKTCNRALLPQHLFKWNAPSWDDGDCEGELLRDIVDEYKIYQEWRETE